MKNTRSRSFAVVIISFGFIIGISVFLIKFFKNANVWAFHPKNAYVMSLNAESCGRILDRNGEILARSENGERVYSEDESIRKACLHVVGDTTPSIATSVQNLYRDDLLGYNLFFGINIPEFMRESKDIKLSIDSELCKKALEGLGEKKGCVCVYNYKTGEVLCMVSTPTYDPAFSPNASDLNSSKYEGVYINRCISACYPPGSTFKIITGACAIHNNQQNKIYGCNKIQKFDDGEINCMSNHGDLNFKNAMAQSCNIYFADLAMDLGKNNMTSTANSFGFNKSFDLDRVTLKKSIYDVSKASISSLGWSGIGQYEVMANPMHMMLIMGAIADDGVSTMPSLLYDKKVQKGPRFLAKEEASELSDVLKYVVDNNGVYGGLRKFSAYAKTGTAEVGEGKEPHAWVVGFLKDPNMPFAFSVIVENSGFGSRVALPIAVDVISFMKGRRY